MTTYSIKVVSLLKTCWQKYQNWIENKWIIRVKHWPIRVSFSKIILGKDFNAWKKIFVVYITINKPLRPIIISWTVLWYKYYPKQELNWHAEKK